MKTTELIPTQFCTTTGVIQILVPQIQDGRHLENRNITISHNITVQWPRGEWGGYPHVTKNVGAMVPSFTPNMQKNPAGTHVCSP